MKQTITSTIHSRSSGRASVLSRRNFLMGSAAAGLGALHWPAVAQTRLRAGLVGCGHAGQRIADAIARGDLGMDLHAVCDASPEAAQALAGSGLGVPVVDWRDLIEDDCVDAVIIATPDHLHGPLALASLERGKHVFLMPPLAMTAGEVLGLRASAESRGLVVQTCMANGCDVLWEEARKQLTAHGGGLRHIHAVCSATPAGGTWQAQRGQSLGPAATAIFEMLYPLHYHLNPGAPERVSAMGGIFDAGNRETLDSLTVSLRYPDGLTAVLTSSPSAGTRPSITLRGPWPAIELHGDAAGPAYDLTAELTSFVRAVRRETADCGARLRAASSAQIALCDAVDRVGRTLLS